MDVLAERTVETLGTLLGGGGGVDVALELNRVKGRNDPGVDYDSLLAIRARVGDARLGFCWDFGHTCHNMRKGCLPSYPPPAFLQGVIHTHIHDLGPGDQTHWPLGRGLVPVGRWVGLLADAGYGGVLNLELEPGRFADGLDLRTATLESVALLREAAR